LHHFFEKWKGGAKLQALWVIQILHHFFEKWKGGAKCFAPLFEKWYF
jgi:hypothetical protein